MRTYYVAEGALLNLAVVAWLGRKSGREGMYVYV